MMAHLRSANSGRLIANLRILEGSSSIHFGMKSNSFTQKVKTCGVEMARTSCASIIHSEKSVKENWFEVALHSRRERRVGSLTNPLYAEVKFN